VSIIEEEQMKYKIKDWLSIYTLMSFCCVVGGTFNLAFLLELWRMIDGPSAFVIAGAAVVFFLAGFLNFKSAELLAQANRCARSWPGY
jgi:hypothetical protein